MSQKGGEKGSRKGELWYRREKEEERATGSRSEAIKLEKKMWVGKRCFPSALLGRAAAEVHSASVLVV
jgi:hypothetical protein